MAMYTLDQVRGDSYEDSIWGLDTSGPGNIRTLEEVGDTNACLAMELADKFFDDDRFAAEIDGSHVFHVIRGERYFNRVNYEMWRRIMEQGKPYTIVTWKRVDNH